MITERDLVEGHSSFWQLQAPSLGRLVRSINLAGRDPFQAPLETKASPDRIYLVNEVGFELASSHFQGQVASLSQAVADVEREFEALEGVQGADFRLTPDEEYEAASIGNRLVEAIPEYLPKQDIFQHRPRLRGLGALTDCYADMAFGTTLVEVKSGERNLRSIDFRQIIIYYVLSSMREEGSYNYCYIVNPRQGYRIFFNFDSLIAAVSAKPPVEFVAGFSDYLVDWKACD